MRLINVAISALLGLSILSAANCSRRTVLCSVGIVTVLGHVHDENITRLLTKAGITRYETDAGLGMTRVIVERSDVRVATQILREYGSKHPDASVIVGIDELAPDDPYYGLQ